MPLSGVNETHFEPRSLALLRTGAQVDLDPVYHLYMRVMARFGLKMGLTAIYSGRRIRSILLPSGHVP